jgi:alkylated DNA repair dioxygenase AlkB
MNISIHPNCIKYDFPDADITLYNSFFTKADSDLLYKNLIEKINWEQHEITIFGKTMNQPRLTAFYGDNNKDYSYSGIRLKPTEWNEDLILIKSRIEKITNESFSTVLLNYYRDGRDSMGWHADDEKELGKNPVIASVSFGATRPFQLKHNTIKDLKKVDIELTHGSLLLMKGTTQHHWKHQIPKSAKPIEPRINLTFRLIV